MSATPPPAAERDRLNAAGRAALGAGRLEEARAAFARMTQLAPEDPAGWRGLGNALHRAGRIAEGGEAHLRALSASRNDPELARAARAVEGHALASAYPILRDRLQAEPDDVAALRLMATVAARMGRHDHAIRLFARALELAPAFADALEQLRQSLALLPFDQALPLVDEQLARRPGHLGYRSLRAGLFDHAGDYAAALAEYRAILADAPQDAATWLSLGQVLETVGERAECIAAFRRALAIDPDYGEAWWSLANIKDQRFDAADLAAMRASLARPGLPATRRMMIDFALGKALEDAGDPERAFVHYAQGNRHRRTIEPYNHAYLEDQLARSVRLFTPAFFAERVGLGDPAADPVFIVGMPRSGSTLVEQMLGSHPQVEGTMELPDLTRIAVRLDAPGGRYPEALAALDGAQLAALGQAYLASTRPQRRTERPRFLDKAPTNFRRVGLIHAILPNARIIDVRRHPMACGFSCFRQHFAGGFSFANDLEDLGRYYHAYVRMMAHWDAVLPGRVLRVFYEDLVADPDRELRRMLDYLALPYDAACLRFHENPRSVRTPSASQVRRPLYRDGLESWRAFEPWLGPLAAALGEVLPCYPQVPDFASRPA